MIGSAHLFDRFSQERCMAATAFTDADRRQLAARGLTEQEARRQLELLDRPPRHARLVRPALVGDGIRRLEPAEAAELRAAHAEAALAGRCSKFVPASGAASRMFRDLHPFHRGPGRERSWLEILDAAQRGEAGAAALARTLREIRRFAFHADLADHLRRHGEDLDGLARIGAFQPILDALLGPEGLSYDSLPKGLLKFHRTAEGARTAFEEHLAEAARITADAEGVCRLHFTVPPADRQAFECLLGRVEGRYAQRLGVRFEVGWSEQKPSTDTLAVDAEGRLVRDAEGRLRLRPGGHGALIDNLHALGGDVVFVKNIDNVQPERAQDAAALWRKSLAGLAVTLARGQLDRPLRVCGVVPNTGEPGGGPFWVRGADGSVSLQIVESAEVDLDDAGQREIWRSSTHFNPVDIVCAVRDAAGRPFELKRFVDEDAAIVTSKTEGGREVRVLERPGLWNGAMAGWNTVFVELPIETFTPVKTVLDLLRPEHQP
jgi:hypothetical protein